MQIPQLLMAIKLFVNFLSEFLVILHRQEQVHQQDLKGLIAFCEEHPTTKAIVVSQDKRTRQLKVNDQLTISILPWKIFLKKLWEGEIIQ